MALPELDHLHQALPGLHQAARLLNLVQQLTQDPQPAYLELGLALDPRGLRSGRLPSGAHVLLNFSAASLVYQAPSQAPVTFPLNGASQASIFTDLFDCLARSEPGSLLPPGETLFERAAAGVARSGGRYKPPQPPALLDETTLHIDRRTAENYLQVMQAVFSGIARFKARLRGMQSPLVVWPHGFDLSTLWFPGNEIDEQQAHIAFGFSPGSVVSKATGLTDGGIDYPYLYAYAYPYAGDAPPSGLPEGARWHTQGWQGVLLPYATLAAQPDALQFVETSCRQFFSALAQHLAGLSSLPYLW